MDGGVGREREADSSVPGDLGRRIPGFDNLVRIGSGGSSTVYEALDVRHQRTVAIKILDVDASNGRRRTAFQREIEAIGRIGDHPHIVTVLGSGFTTDDHPYLVLPLFERGTYGELIDEHGPLTWAAAVDVGIKLCSALETVHRAGVVHRDVKPGNVFIGVTPAHPLLADFGISSTIDGERTRTQTMAVTFGYTAPEVLDDERPTTASDIYSLSMTIYRLIQGLHAYYAETPAAVMRKLISDPDRPQLSAGVPSAVATVVADGLNKDPAARPPSALALARRLQKVQLANGLPATPVVVADEPAVAIDESAAPTPTVRNADLDVEDAMVSAARRRHAADSASTATTRSAPVERSAATEPGVRDERVDVGGVLAAAIAEFEDRQLDERQSTVREPATGPEDTAGDVALPSLDLPTVVTPRKPRNEPPTSVADGPSRSRQWLLIVLLLLVVVVAVAAGGFVFYR